MIRPRDAMTSDRSCHSNKMTPLPTAITCSNFVSPENCSYKIDHGNFFFQYGRLDVREVKAESVTVLWIYFGMKFLSLEKSWCLAVFCRKRGAFDYAISPRDRFNLVKGVCERSCRLLEKKDLISMHRGALVSGFVNILVYFNKLANNFKTAR